MPLTDEEKRALDEMGDDRLGQSLYRAARKNPDESAKIIQISDSQGLPTDTVERNRVETEARHKYGNISVSELRKASPITAEYLEDNARVSIDDIPVLRGIEKALTDSATPWSEVFSRSFDAGTLGLAKSASEIIGQMHIGLRYPIADYMDDRERAELYKRVNSSSSASRLRDELAQLDTPEEKQALRDKYADIIENPLTPEQSARRTQDILSDPDIASQRNISTSLDQQASEMRIKTDRFTPRGVISAAIESVTHMVPGLALGALTGTGSIALGSIAAHVYGQELYYGREVLGLDENTNLGRAFTMASTETLAEILPVMAFLGKSGADTALRQWLLGTFGEAGEEVITELVQKGLDKGIYEKDANMDKVFDWLFSLEGLKDLGFSGLVGGLVGTVLVAPSASIQLYDQAVANKAQKNMIRTARSMEEQQRLAEFISLSQSSKTRKRAQDQFKAFLSAAGKDTAIYVHAAEINKLTEQGVVLPKYILEQAAEIDSDVEIPVDRFHELGDDVIAQLNPHIKLNADSMTQTELEAGEDTSIKALMKRASKSKELKTQADKLYEEVKSQVVASGRQGEETAKWSAAIIPAFATVIAETRGITVHEAYAAMNFKVVGPSTPVSDADAVRLAQDDGFKGSDVTEAHEWLAARATPDLDMSFEARMARADESYPVKAYHGTQADIKAETGFLKHDADMGYHFGSTASQANRRIMQRRMEQQKQQEMMEPEVLFNDNITEAPVLSQEEGGANVMPIRLNLRNPIILQDAGDWRNSTAVAYALREAANIDTDATAKFIELYEEARTTENEFESNVEWLASPENIEIQDEIRQLLKDYGYDGIEYENTVEGAGSSYIVFEPEQVRSVFAAFDPALKDSVNILAQERRLNKQIGTIERLIECLAA